MLDLQLFSEDGVSIARIRGDLAGADVPDVTETLQEAVTGDAARLILDLSEMTLLDSSGLAALIHLTNRARLTGGKVVLVGPTPFVSGVLRTTRLDKWFDLAPDIAAARDLLGG